MKISYNWLKEYISNKDNSEVLIPVETAGEYLTDTGLEIESIEHFESIKGGLAGLVIGEVKTKEKHPDADRLNLTTVDVGKEELLNIVCGASNVAAGQKVVIATIGTTLYAPNGESFTIKKSKIRGQLSEGMICAEDEIGLGTSHDGIMVLDESAKVGTPIKEYFKVERDDVLEIGLTPNRADATSHVGVARDLVAVVNCRKDIAGEKEYVALRLPSVEKFKVDSNSLKIDVVVEDTEACPRYSGLSISGVKVEESPDWLKSRLSAIGLRPINNIVDITNYVLHELGQPMHAFDADKIKGEKVIVKKLPNKTKFTTLDQISRELSDEDLMICDEEGGMCIAGVFGGATSGVTESTKNVFLESAYFNATSVRKSSKRHGLKTDASFRYERGTDPNMTVYALKRAAMLIKEVSGGEISSDVIDIYPKAIGDFSISFSYEKCDDLIGKKIDRGIIKNILLSLGIKIVEEKKDALLLSVPPFKVDVQREQDVIEEVLRIYGYNNIEIPTKLNSSIQFSEKPDKEKIQAVISDMLTDKGFSEIMCLSLTKSEYAKRSEDINEECNVEMMNPLSSDLNVLRQTTLYSGLETIAYNQNRKNADLKLYEFGKTYSVVTSGEEKKYIETKHLSVFLTGKKRPESWNAHDSSVNFYTLKGVVQSILNRLGINDVKIREIKSDDFSSAISFVWGKKTLVNFGTVSKKQLKYTGVNQDVFYADFNWDIVIEALRKNKVMYAEVPKFPEVRRDLALLIDKTIQFEQLKDLAYQSERKLLKSVNLFDIYEGDKLPAGKKSYALSFTLQDEEATLTDKQIDKTMEKLMKSYKENIGAEIR